MLPNDLIQLQDLWGAKTALRQGHQRKGAIHLFCTLWLYKRKWSNGNCLLPNLKNLNSYPGQSAEQEEIQSDMRA